MNTLDIANFAIIHFILKLLLAILYQHPKDLSILRQRRVGNLRRSLITYLLHRTISRGHGFLTVFSTILFSRPRLGGEWRMTVWLHYIQPLFIFQLFTISVILILSVCTPSDTTLSVLTGLIIRVFFLSCSFRCTISVPTGYIPLCFSLYLFLTPADRLICLWESISTTCCTGFAESICKKPVLPKVVWDRKRTTEDT